jgi:hypothetical protein
MSLTMNTTIYKDKIDDGCDKCPMSGRCKAEKAHTELVNNIHSALLQSISQHGEDLFSHSGAIAADCWRLNRPEIYKTKKAKKADRTVTIDVDVNQKPIRKAKKEVKDLCKKWRKTYKKIKKQSRLLSKQKEE